MIRIANEAEFHRLLAGLADDIVDAHIHYRLHQDLIEAIRQYPLVASQSNTFWASTLKAHLTMSLTALARAYDSDTTSLHLPSFLNTVKAHPELFSENRFRERKKGNLNLEELASQDRLPDGAQLLKDIEICSNRDPLVRTLIIHRSATLAHRNARNTAKGNSVSSQHPLTFAEFEMLLARALEVLNRYCMLFEASSYSPRPIGARDFEYIFQSVSAAVEESRKRAEQALTFHSR